MLRGDDFEVCFNLVKGDLKIICWFQSRLKQIHLQLYLTNLSLVDFEVYLNLVKADLDIICWL